VDNADCIGLIVPTYGAYDYAYRTALSALMHTSCHLKVLLIDDGYADAEERAQPHYKPLLEDPQLAPHIETVWFKTNGGYIRSLNYGLRCLRNTCSHICCANSDLIFTKEWDYSLREALDGIFSLAGPVTNAPGTERIQNVANYFEDYEVTDNEVYLDTVARSLAEQDRVPFEATINGFCMMAKTETWWENAYDKQHVFCPLNERDSKGNPNPTPLMTLNEYELQRRWHAKGLKSACCPRSFVFHYRSVTRGDRFKKSGWYRKQK
jgi:hypothetical protein